MSYWRPAREVIFFKRNVYRRALKELEPLLQGLPRPPLPPAERKDASTKRPGTAPPPAT